MIGNNRHPKIPGKKAPAPPARLTTRAEARKSAPRPPRRFVSAKELQGETSSTSAISTSRRRSSAKTSRRNSPKLSPTNRWSGPAQGMKRKMAVGRKTIEPRRQAASQSGKCLAISPPRTDVTPVPEITAMLTHALSLFLSSWRQTVESQPQSAVVNNIPVATPATSAAPSTAGRCRFMSATMTRTEASAAKTVAYQRRLNQTSSIGPNTTGQKLEDIAAAVITAMVASETCCAANNWGTAKNAIPLLSPTVEFERPISQTGGTRWLNFRQTSRILLCYTVLPTWLALIRLIPESGGAPPVAAWR